MAELLLTGIAAICLIAASLAAGAIIVAVIFICWLIKGEEKEDK